MQDFSNFSRATSPTATILPGLLDNKLSQQLVLTATSIQFAINIIGVAGNIVNIMVFVKMRFSDSTTVSLMALAVSDLISVVTGIWANICNIPEFRDSGITFKADEVYIFTGAWIHNAISRAIGFITAFISVERCIAVLFPLKVKTWITPRGNFIAMVIIYVITIGPSLGVYWSFKLGWRFYPTSNRTLLGLISIDSPFARGWFDFASLLFGLIYSFSAFIVVSVSTRFLIVNLNRAQRWRQAQSGTRGIDVGKATDTKDITSKRIEKVTKEDRAVKMVITIACVFIVSTIPGCISYLAMAVVPEFNLLGRYRNLNGLAFCIAYLGESVNSTANIFVYYSMTAKYRKILRKMLGAKES